MILVIINDILLKLQQKNYHKVTVNVDGIYLYYTVILEQAYVILLYNMNQGNEFTKEQCENITDQVMSQFGKKNFEQIHILNLLCTNNTEKVKNIPSVLENCWIVDTKERKLILFEHQNSSFLDMRTMIEEILKPIIIEPYKYEYTGEDREIYKKDTYTTPINNNEGRSHNTNNYGGQSQRNYSRRNYFTICNTLIILINVIIFFYLEMNGSTMDTDYMLNNGAMFWPYVVTYEEYHRLFTYMFLHFGFRHLANNMIILIFIGDNLERAAGKIRYLLIYLGSGVIAGVASMGYNMIQNNNVVAVGASGAIFGVVGSMLYIVLVNRGRLEDISTGQLIIFAILSIYSGFSSQEIDNVAHIAGFIAGLLIAALIYRKPKKREVY